MAERRPEPPPEGQDDAPLTDRETAVQPSGVHPASPSPTPATRSDRRFTPGEMLAGRYRIVAPLGKGGMGEVYRAEDTKLGHPVALKFLPEALARDPARLSRLYGEVRIGRQISHPNVCRIYDIVEAEGHHFLAMEYVDGEDLASLLNRIGRLPKDKALDIARELCAGLAAAHDLGVVHRDLKPANVMIDGRGRARIADFGLAAPVHEAAVETGLAGTPAYMAPEQLAGRPASVQSDLYALGLVLYELLTGKRLFEAKSLPELVALHAQAKPTSLSGVGREIDPAVERVVLSCLEKEPGARPLSARAVMAALPGGDPLQAALAAGETPSPEMVAASGKVGDLQPAVAWAWLSAALVALVLVPALASRTMLYGRVPLPKSPEVLVERAREILGRLGYPDPPAGSISSFWIDGQYSSAANPVPKRWERVASVRPSPFLFFYRQSPRPLFAWDISARVSRSDPPSIISGMAEVMMDPRGRLIGFRVVPPQFDDSEGPWPDPDWSLLFAAAGLEAGAFKATRARWAASGDSDRKAAWDGTHPDQPDVPIHIEAASYRGRPVWFEIQGPWVRPTRMGGGEPPTTLGRIFQFSFMAVILVTFWGGIALARRNLLLDRGDWKGAFKVAGFVLFVLATGRSLTVDHVTTPFDEFKVQLYVALLPLYWSVQVWLAYMALEPYVRRRWPHILIAWSRLLAGGFRDPLVGRDVLFGSVAGLVITAFWHLNNLAPAWLGVSLSPYAGAVRELSAVRRAMGALFSAAGQAVVFPILALFLLLLLHVVVRKHWLAVGLLFLYYLVDYLPGQNVAVESLFGALVAGVQVAVLWRFGLLSLVVTGFVVRVLQDAPLTLDFSAWYAGRSLTVMLVLAALAAWGFHTSLGGKPVFGRRLLED